MLSVFFKPITLAAPKYNITDPFYTIKITKIEV